jgi:hypothetical protein
LIEYITNPDEVRYPSYDVEIRNNETGETRTYHNDLGWGEATEFIWTEGNYACDCNRHLFFERSNGGTPDVMSGECGDSKYTVIEAIFPDGKRFKIDGHYA